VPRQHSSMATVVVLVAEAESVSLEGYGY
jgi:hypothetical protein